MYRLTYHLGYFSVWMNPYEFLELSLKRERMFPTWMKTFFHGETYFEVNCEHPKVKYLNLIATDRSCASDVVQVLLWQRSYVPELGSDFSITYTYMYIIEMLGTKQSCTISCFEEQQKMWHLL